MRILLLFVILFILLWIYQIYQNTQNNANNANNANNTNNANKSSCTITRDRNGQVINYNLWNHHYYPAEWSPKLCPVPNFNGTYRQETNNFAIDQKLSPGIKALFTKKMPQRDFPPFLINCRECDITGKVRIGVSDMY
jgi:hypothetical protein